MTQCARRPICPFCSQGQVEPMIVRATRERIQICEECDSVWPKGAEVGTSGATNLGSYMESRGLRPLWTELVMEELAPFLKDRG